MRILRSGFAVLNGLFVAAILSPLSMAVSAEPAEPAAPAVSATADATRKLLEGAQNCSPSKVQRALAQGGDPNVRSDANQTPLICAAICNDLETTKLLLSKGADVNFQSPEVGLSALMQAASTASLDVVQVLLDSGAKVSLSAFNGSTALHEALMRQRYATANLLLRKGADPNIRIKEIPILFFSLQKENVRAVRLLRQYGVRPDDRGPESHAATAGKTPLQVAEEHGWTTIAAELKGPAKPIAPKDLVNVDAEYDGSSSKVSTTGRIASVQGSRLLLDIGHGEMLLFQLRESSVFRRKAPDAGEYDRASVVVKTVKELQGLDIVTVTNPFGQNLVISIDEGPLIISNFSQSR